MKPTIEKRKNGRRIVGYVATLGPCSEGGDSAEKAALACERELLAGFGRLQEGMRVFFWQGRPIVVSPERDGWAYWFDNGGERPWPLGQGYDSRQDAYEHGLHHLAQCLWSIDLPDDVEFLASIPVDRVREQLQAWTSWQRSYKFLRESGMSDEEARMQAR